jgi:hypothetical protein
MSEFASQSSDACADGRCVDGPPPNRAIVRKMSSKAMDQEHDDCFVYASVRVATRLIMEILDFPFISQLGDETFTCDQLQRSLSSPISQANSDGEKYIIAYAKLRKYIMENVVRRFDRNGQNTPSVLVWIIEFLFNKANAVYNDNVRKSKTAIETIEDVIKMKVGEDRNGGFLWNPFDYLQDNALRLLILNASKQNAFNYVVRVLYKKQIEKQPFQDTAKIISTVLEQPSNLYAAFSISADDDWWHFLSGINSSNITEETDKLIHHQPGDEGMSHVVVIKNVQKDKNNKYSLEFINSWGDDWAIKGNYSFSEELFQTITDYSISFYENFEGADPKAKEFTRITIKRLNAEGAHIYDSMLDQIKITIEEQSSSDMSAESQTSTNESSYTKRLKTETDRSFGGKSRTYKRVRPLKPRKNTKKARAQNKRTRKLHRNRRRNHTRAKLLSR